MSRLKKILIIAVLSIAAHQGCGNREASDEGSNGVEVDSPNHIPVQTHVIQRGEVVDLVRAPGTLFQLNAVRISSQTDGTVIKVYVKVGDPVEKGTPLVQIDPELKELTRDQG